MESIVKDIAMVGFTLFICVTAMLIVNWLDRNVFSKHKNFDDTEDKKGDK